MLLQLPGSNWLFNNLLPALIATSLVTIFAAFFRKEIWIFLRKSRFWISNEPINASIKYVDKYDGDPEADLDREVYERISEQSDIPVSSPEIHNNDVIKFQAEGVPVKIAVRLEKVLDYSGGSGMGGMNQEPSVKGYKVLIETEPQLQFGYRKDGALREFEKLCNTISDVTGTVCFPGENPEQSYTVGRITRGIPPGVTDIEDESRGISMNLQDSELQLRVKKPQNLTSGIRRYFRPLKGGIF